MTIRYFDCQGRQLSREELQAMNITTPVMEHIVATVAQRANAGLKLESVASLGEQVDGDSFM